MYFLFVYWKFLVKWMKTGVPPKRPRNFLNPSSGAAGNDGKLIEVSKWGDLRGNHVAEYWKVFGITLW